MSSSVVKLLQITAFTIATVALFLNINAGVGLSQNQRIQLSVDINLLDSVPTEYPIYPDNITVNSLNALTQCTVYVETHVPTVEYFNTTIVINVTHIEAQLSNLTTLMEGRGTVTINHTGTVVVSETNVTLGYSKEYITFGNSELWYIAIEPGTLMVIESNGTTGLTFGGWDPPTDVGGSTGYNAIYDINQLDVQSALPVIRVQKKQYLNDGSIILSESPVAVNEGDVISVVRRLSL